MAVVQGNSLNNSLVASDSAESVAGSGCRAAITNPCCCSYWLSRGLSPTQEESGGAVSVGGPCADRGTFDGAYRIPTTQGYCFLFINETAGSRLSNPTAAFAVPIPVYALALLGGLESLV